ncbi:sulfite exporter TauE/SafE family protein [Rhodococcus sp. AD45-ID]|uniref:sulfite exporter TauE/SafE family protein n=1 Tax=unclassified Rhodococcus (in: high G+C Gram-positive bacteria) TaxID=192944 RepID=UPI0005D2DE86|nr:MULTISPECIES: sulfite exporter TauE/SafE family protein [unclassified Rhodococcus (in: high G+C Gram-positive bacteria)]KJF22666.1 Sulfite exporter TauE/SafE [Rhodococcus sp. AD45]MDV8070889.1 sulfite exporter TauE/SafE family protein [Rhodococcus sp. IEGM 1366]NRI64457.1 sulfite exporter TauE/SafE family protein [Rhodococcus sp. MS16]PSR40250.1 sulfite exporter TauE/SafE family protein [Rhodococcus sp. AD45-ID]
MTLAIALAAGAVIGILLGLLGGGGSILAVPVLVFALGLDIDQAIPISLIVVGVASAVGAIPKVRAHLVQWRLAAVFAAAGIPATFIGSALGRLLPQSVVMTGFAAVMIVAGARMLADRGNAGTACSVGDSGINWRRCAPRAIPAGFAVGVLTGLFGVGGGFLIIPALVLMLGIDMQIAIGTSLLIIVANSAAGLISHLGSGVAIDPAITISFSGAAIVASLVAGRFGNRVNTGSLQRWFAYLVFAVAAYILFDTLALSR